MSKNFRFLFGWNRSLRMFLVNTSRGVLVFPLFVCISCASLNVASREGQATGPEKQQSSSNRQCKPLSEGLYVVQAGAFKHITYAQTLRNTLEENGYKSYITVSGFEEDKRIFRVLLGKFTDRKHAQSLSEEVRKKTNLDVIVALKPPKDKFVVQAGCFTDMGEARALRKKLADNGHNAYITFSGTGSDKQHNVLLGEYLDRAEAERVSEEIRQKENIPVFVNTL